MNYQYSPLPQKQYLAALKRGFSPPWWIFDERITGIVAGPCFAVAHYQGHEWNRRITNECNRAYGFVKQTEGELEICYIRGKGLMAPGWILVYTLLCRSIFLYYEIDGQQSLGAVAWIVSVCLALFAGIVTAIQHSLTEAGMQGAREVDKFLRDPENYYC